MNVISFLQSFHNMNHNVCLPTEQNIYHRIIEMTFINSGLFTLFYEIEIIWLLFSFQVSYKIGVTRNKIYSVLFKDRNILMYLRNKRLPMLHIYILKSNCIGKRPQ